MNMKRFHLTGNAAAYIAAILAGNVMMTCFGGSRYGNSSGDNLVLEFSGGDYLTGKPYRVTANQSLRESAACMACSRRSIT